MGCRVQQLREMNNKRDLIVEISDWGFQSAPPSLYVDREVAGLRGPLAAVLFRQRRYQRVYIGRAGNKLHFRIQYTGRTGCS